MKLSIYDIKGDVVKNDDTYLLKDNKTLKNLVVRSRYLCFVPLTAKFERKWRKSGILNE